MQILHNLIMKNTQEVSELKRIRIEAGITQKEAADKLGVSLRSYITYESDESKENTIKYRYFLRELREEYSYDETHGILTVEKIKEYCNEVFREYDVEFCYLFGSYARGDAKNTSDVDLLVSANTSGIRFYELTEKLREKIHKNIDLLDIKQIINNEELLKEVLKGGVKIYDQQQE